MHNKLTVLGIETSCDDTCASVMSGDSVLSNVVSSQCDFHNIYGGIVPEMASRLHVQKIDLVIQKAISEAKINFKDLDCIAYTEEPGLSGSLFVGKVAAQTLSLLLQVPLIKINHLHGHIFSAAINNKFSYPLIGLVISGGHSNFYYCEDNLLFTQIGTTYDDAIGECYDKVARILGLGYPGGPIIDELAKKGVCRYKVPMPDLYHDQTFNFSFSGIKSWVYNFVKKRKKTINVPDMCASFQRVVVELVIKKIKLVLKEYKVSQFVIGGGVSCNSELRRRLVEEIKNVDILIPEIPYTTDNAAMIAKMGSEIFSEKKKEKLWEIKTTLL